MRKYLQKIHLELLVLKLAWQESKLSWPARLLIFLSLAYAFSPIDLIPDFIPVLGLLDDVLILPVLIFFALQFIPDEHKKAYRRRAVLEKLENKYSFAGAIIVVLLWISMLVAGIFWWTY